MSLKERTKKLKSKIKIKKQVNTFEILRFSKVELCPSVVCQKKKYNAANIPLSSAELYVSIQINIHHVP